MKELGWFQDPQTQQKVVILPRENETDDEAIARVTKHHGVSSSDVKPMSELHKDDPPAKDPPAAGVSPFERKQRPPRKDFDPHSTIKRFDEGFKAHLSRLPGELPDRPKATDYSKFLAPDTK